MEMSLEHQMLIAREKIGFNLEQMSDLLGGLILSVDETVTTELSDYINSLVESKPLLIDFPIQNATLCRRATTSIINDDFIEPHFGVVAKEAFAASDDVPFMIFHDLVVASTIPLSHLAGASAILNKNVTDHMSFVMGRIEEPAGLADMNMGDKADLALKISQIGLGYVPLLAKDPSGISLLEQYTSDVETRINEGTTPIPYIPWIGKSIGLFGARLTHKLYTQIYREINS